MIFSMWQPDGGYKYFESQERHGIGDDLPHLKYPANANRLGVPAQDVGRKLPGDAKYVGSGTEPQGVITRMDRGEVKGLSGLTINTSSTIGSVLVLGLAVWFGYQWGRK